MTLNEYKDKLQKLQAEIQYIDQQRQSRVEDALKVVGAIEALEAHKCTTETTETNNDTTNIN